MFFYPSILKFAIFLIGVIAKVAHKNTIAQVPVKRVMNSIGLAVNESVNPSHINLTNGKIQNR
jgi:hypothetical protein